MGGEEGEEGEEGKEGEEGEEGEEKEEEEVEIVPFVSDDCADTEGLIEVSDGGEKLNCREIRKTKICDRKHNGLHLYDSCQKSCGICLEAIPTTDAPTADLIELIVTENPTDESYKSYAPSYQPTIKFTDEPTESPSQYPTAYPTENEIAEILDGLDDDLLLEILGDGQ